MGVSLLSLRVDPVPCVNAGALPLVGLGRCNPDAVAAVLQQVRS
ncbi:hypothetical protein [Streptomyces sp. SID10853]|nr:hypothetical protein [Streptomyces sp. SID10853]